MKRFICVFMAFAINGMAFTQETLALSKQEEAAILYMREEEKLARDVYDFLYARWSVNPFGNIRRSEQTHMDKMKTLIALYKLEDPVAKNGDKPGVFVNTVIQNYYNELTVAGSASLVAALKAGAKIEELDIADLTERVQQTSRPDIINTYHYLKMASEHHLVAFVKRLKMLGVNYEPVIIGTDAFRRIVGIVK